MIAHTGDKIKGLILIACVNFIFNLCSEDLLSQNDTNLAQKYSLKHTKRYLESS